MKNQNRHVSKARLTALLLSVLLLAGLLPSFGALAETGNLTVKLQEDIYASLPANSKVQVTLYRIGRAAPETKAGWSIDSAFSGFGILKAETSDELGTAAKKLAGEIVGKSQYTGTQKTLEGGQTTFSGLNEGVYFGMMSKGPEGLEVTPFIVTIPASDPETKAMRHSYDITLKSANVFSTTVRKVWDDNDDRDGMRPKNLTVTLAESKKGTIKTVNLNDANDWTYTEENLPRYEGGEKLVYTWTEAEVEHYDGSSSVESVTNGEITTLTNTHKPETVSLTVRKDWRDDDDQDGKRPATLTVTLLGDTKKVGTATLNAANNWTDTISNLPKYANGQEIKYTWTEAEVEGYTAGVPVVDGLVTTLVNTHTPDTTSATVEKVWDDNDNQDGKRPQALTVTLFNGTEDVNTVTLNAANGWKATVTTDSTGRKLPKNENGQEIVYTWYESDLPEGYTLTGNKKDGLVTTLTNSYSPETTSATVRKVWVDGKNQDNIRPKELTVTLSNGTENVGTVTLNAANGWTDTISDLPKFANGQEIEYTWTEDGLPEGYELTGSKKEGTLTTLTNTHTPDTTSATVTKAWDDADNRDGLRPASLKVRLSNGTLVELNADNNWTVTVDDLPKYAKGREIVYNWTEESMPEGYALTSKEKDGTVTTLTNVELTSATVIKVWDDNENQDGIRPTTLTVTLSDGQSVSLNSGNGWRATIDNLPKYSNGQLIQYVWLEADKDQPEGYYLSGTVTEGTVTTLTNTHTPEVTQASVQKVWEDNDNQDGIRPASLTVTLSNGQSVTLNEANHWFGTIENLPKYANGREIKYTWTEDGLPEGYELASSEVDGTITTLTNSYMPDETSATVRKVWEDNDNQDGIRPESLTVTLSNGQSVTLSAENNWEATIDHLPRYANGQLIDYSWTETDLPEGYVLTRTEHVGTLTTLTNTHTVVTPTPTPVVTPTPTPTPVVTPTPTPGDTPTPTPGDTPTPTPGDTPTPTPGDTPTPTPGDTPTPTPDDTPTPTPGDTPTPTPVVTPTPTPGDTPTPTPTTTAPPPPPPGGGNTPTPTPVPTTEVTGHKVWEDESNVHKTRPESITVQLYANGALVNATPTWSGTNSDNWTYTFSNLPAVNASGATIRYTVRELTVNGYDSSVSGTTITNRLIPRTPKEYREFSGVKTWQDGGNASGQRPAHVRVHLFRDGQEIAARTVTAINDWTYTFGSQPLDDGYGNTYTYELREDGVAGYFSRVDGMNLINISLSRTPGNPTPGNPDNPDSPYVPMSVRQEVPTRGTGTQLPSFEERSEEELEELFDLFGYGTPLWGQLLGTGDETPIYPYIFGGVGVLAVALLLILTGKRRRKTK